ncbi:MAG: hypothetical protein IKQ41_08040 [Clostridia bacterium]|nr:hypothetical protein [Clostridia bacterium]
MLGILYLILFGYCGTLILFCLFPRKSLLVRIWLGLCLGLVLMMWLPAIAAFILKFSIGAHALAMGVLILLSVLAYVLRDKASWAPWTEQDTRLLKTLAFTVLPLTLIGAYLQWTHIIMPVSNGSLHVGQSTYGDLPLHLSIITGMRNASFPADYSILPGYRLAYPFLADTLSTSFMLLGLPLRAAVLVPGILMTALTFTGYAILADRMAASKRAAILAVFLFFVNGGLGFMYLVDMQGEVLGSYGNNELQSVKGLWERIEAVLSGWYQTPTNHAEFGTYNLRWSNVIVDMMVPQRTTLAGWCQVLPCLYLLYDTLQPPTPWGVEFMNDEGGPTAVWHKRELTWRQMLLLGVWAGMLPMVNTHCFLALALASLGFMIYDLVHCRHEMKKAFLFWLVYGAIAAAVALPQLFIWTFGQTVGNEHFLTFHFNWVNNTGGGLRDGYLWFYIKNIGVPFILILLSLLEKNEKRRFLAAGAFVIFLAAELIQFQPNEYDNNKLFYIWYMLCAVLAADYGFELLDRMKGLRARPVVAALSLIVFFSSGALSIARECKSDYQMFSKEAVAAAEFVEENTEPHATFLTGTEHINLICSLAGRRIVCGTDIYLYMHGYDTESRKQDIRAFYADPVGNIGVLTKYGVKYIFVSSYERSDYTVNTQALDANFQKIYESAGNDAIVIYAVSGI